MMKSLLLTRVGASTGAVASSRARGLALRPLPASSRPLRDASRRAEAKEEDRGHQVPQVYTDDAEVSKYREHQQKAARITFAQEARTIIELGKFGTLATNDSTYEGHPTAAVVAYANDDQGRPIFSFSRLAQHTQDLLKDGRASLCVSAPGFQDLADGRFTLVGALSLVPDTDKEAVQQAFLKRHPEAYWVTFGDFALYRMDGIKVGRLIGGFGRIGKVTAEDYMAAKPDPVAAFSGPVCGHMNDDHVDSILSMLKHYTGLTVDEARMTSIDRLGFNVAAKRGGQNLRARLPFPSEAADRKSIKDRIVEMTQASAEHMPFFQAKLEEAKAAAKARGPPGRPQPAAAGKA